MDKQEENSSKLLKNLLGSVDLSDIDELEKKELSQNEFIERAANADIFYKTYFEKILKLFIQKQLEWIGTQASTTEQLMFGRGTINGLFLIKDWFKEQSDAITQYREDNKPPETIYGKI